MSEPKYVFDTNIFINLKNWYVSDIFVGLWEKLEMLLEESIVISSDEVLDEIKRGNDGFEKLTKKWSSAFYPSDEPIQLGVRKILRDFGILGYWLPAPKSQTQQTLSLSHWQKKRSVS